MNELNFCWNKWVLKNEICIENVIYWSVSLVLLACFNVLHQTYSILNNFISKKQQKVLTMWQRPFFRTWTPSLCVQQRRCVRSGTVWYRRACYGRSWSREWCGQTLCGGDWQRGGDGGYHVTIKSCIVFKKQLYLIFNLVNVHCFGFSMNWAAERPCINYIY